MTMILMKDNEMIKLILTSTPQWMGTAATQRALEGRLLLVNLLCKVVSIMVKIMIIDDHDDHIHDGYDADGAGDAVLQVDADDQDHGDDDGGDD